MLPDTPESKEGFQEGFLKNTLTNSYNKLYLKSYVMGNYRDRYRNRRGFTIPGYKYTGPNNSLYRGRPTNALDKASMFHDRAYDKLQRKTGKNPKFYWNQGDSDYLDYIHRLPDADRSGIGYHAANTFFSLKRHIAPVMEPIQRKRARSQILQEEKLDTSDIFEPKSDTEPPVAIKKKIDDMITNGYKKPKLVSRRTTGKSKIYPGNWAPIQEHEAATTYQVSSSSNQLGYDMRTIVDLNTISQQMFNPRYFQKWSKSPSGVSGALGVTSDVINAMSGSGAIKSIFQWGDTSNFVNSNYNVHNENPDNLTDGTTTLSAAGTAYALQGAGKFSCKTKIDLNNNEKEPVIVEIYEVNTNRDFLTSSFDLPTHFFSRATDGAHMSYSHRDWDGNTIVTVADGADASSEYLNPSFKFGDINKQAPLFSDFRIGRKWIVKLKAGETSSLIIRHKPMVFDIRTTTQRLQALGWNTGPGAGGGTTGIDTSLGKYSLRGGFNQYLLFKVKGTLAHDSLGLVGLSASVVDVQQKTYYYWTLKYSAHVCVPTKYSGWSGNADNLVVEGEAIEVEPPV